MKLPDLVEKYCLFNVLRPESQACYKATVSVFLRRCPEASAGTEVITMEMLLQFRADILKTGSAVSFNTHRNRLRTLFRFGVREGFLSTDPIEKVGLAPVQGRRRKTISTGTTQMLISHLEQSGPRNTFTSFWVAVTRMLYYTGMRRRQLVGLRWEDVSTDTMMLTLRADSSKTRREWEIPLPEGVLNDLAWLKERRLAVSGKVEPEHVVFDITLVRPKAPPLSGPRITSYFWYWGQKLGVKVSPHRFRHSVATTVVNSTGNLKVAQEILGHADLKTTGIYVHPSVSAMRTAMSHITPLG